MADTRARAAAAADADDDGVGSPSETQSIFLFRIAGAHMRRNPLLTRQDPGQELLRLALICLGLKR